MAKGTGAKALAVVLCVALITAALGGGCGTATLSSWENWATIQPQVQANTVLVSQGYNITHADYELLESEESETEVMVRADYTFDLSHEGNTLRLSGEGVYRWQAAGSDGWTEGVSLNLATAEGIATCTINYAREYSSRAGTYRIETTRSTSSTLEGLSGSTFTSSLSSIPTSANSNRVQFIRETAGCEGVTRLEGAKEETFTSPTEVAGTAEMTQTTNGASPRVFSTRYTKTVALDYEDYLLLEMSPLLEIGADYETYDITIEETTFSLEEPAYFHAEETTPGNYIITWKLKVGNGAETLVNTAGAGNLQETIADGKSTVTASVEELISGDSYLFYVDPIPFLLIGGIIVGVATVIGAGAAVYCAVKPEPCSACGADGLMKKDCADCGATGELNCPKCGGDGTVSCQNCEGLGSVPCPRCNGYGKVQCPWCKGLGCPICEDSSWLYCPDCKGKGSLPCPACGGSGDVKCSICGGGGELGCPGCGGEGWNLIQCPHCGGDGSR